VHDAQTGVWAGVCGRLNAESAAGTQDGGADIDSVGGGDAAECRELSLERDVGASSGDVEGWDGGGAVARAEAEFVEGAVEPQGASVGSVAFKQVDCGGARVGNAEGQGVVGGTVECAGGKVVACLDGSVGVNCAVGGEVGAAIGGFTESPADS
jgi:hypothetical protein